MTGQIQSLSAVVQTHFRDQFRGLIPCGFLFTSGLTDCIPLLFFEVEVDKAIRTCFHLPYGRTSYKRLRNTFGLHGRSLLPAALLKMMINMRDATLRTCLHTPVASDSLTTAIGIAETKR